MSFKNIILVLLVLTATSCSYFFDEKDRKSNTYDLSLTEKSNLNCIEKNKALLRDYFNLQRSNEVIASELKEMNTCLNDAIKLFVKHTKGAQSDYYTPIEIHDFLSSVFESYSFGPQFLEDVVLLKDSLLGGTQYKISKDEIRKLPQYIDFVYTSLAELAPERHLLFSKRQGDRWADFEKASKKLENIAGRFKNLPLKSTGTFDYLSMVRLAASFIDDEDSQWKKTFDLLNSIQAILVNGQRDIIKIDELTPLVENFATLYLSYMEFNKFIRDNADCAAGDEDCLKKGFFRDLSSIFLFPGLVTRLVDHPNAYQNKVDIIVSAQMKILKTLSGSLAKTGGVSMDYVYDFIATLSRTNALPESIKASTLNAMAPEFFSVFLSSTPCVDTSSRCLSTVVKSEQIDAIVEMIKSWQERQKWIDANLNLTTMTNRAELTAKMKRTKNISGNLLDFVDAMGKVKHAHWTQYVNIGSDVLTYKDLTIFNNLFTIIKIFMTPFNGNAEKTDILTLFLKRDQVQYLYEWFRPLGLELKLMDPRSRTSGNQAFIEINLFGSTSSDAQTMEFTELLEYFQIALSTGSRTEILLTQKFSDCIIPGAVDVFYYEKRTAICFRNEFVTHGKDYFYSTMPHLNTYFEKNAEANFSKQLLALEKAGRQGVVANIPFDADAVRVMGSVAQYAESFFLRFENPNDGDELIIGAELQNGLDHIVPNFKLLIQDSLDPAEVKRLYNLFPNFETDLITYTLNYGKTPDILTAVTTAQTLKAAIQLKTWVNGLANWINGEAKVKREDVMAVVSGLSSFARTSQIKDLRKVFVDNELDFAKGSLKDPTHKVFGDLARELSCSTHKDIEIRQWLSDNQDLYWKDALQYFELNIGDTKHVLSRNDVPQSDLFSGWEGAVVTKLVTALAADPLGAFCGLPFLKDVHQIVE